MRVLVPSLEIRRSGGFGLLDEKGLAAFVMLIERSGDGVMVKTFNWPEAHRVAVTCSQKNRKGGFLSGKGSANAEQTHVGYSS